MPKAETGRSASTPRVYPGPASAGPAMDDVFLTPRVVDQNAFEQFSATLRELMAMAGEQRRTLREATTEAAETDRSSRELRDEVSTRLKALRALLPEVDRRLETAEKMLGAEVDEVEIRRRVREVFERSAAEPLAQLRTRTDDSVQHAHKRVETLLTAMETRLAEAERRAETAASANADRIDEQIRSLESLLTRVQEGVPHIEQRLADAATDAERKAASFGTHLEERVSQIRAELAKATGPAVTNLHLLCSRAVEVIGRDPRLASDPDNQTPYREGSLGDLLEKVGAINAKTRAAADEAEALRKQAEEVGAALRDAILGAADGCDRLEAARERFTTETAESEKAADTLAKAVRKQRTAIESCMAAIDSERVRSLQADTEKIERLAEKLSADEADKAIKQAAKADRALKKIEAKRAELEKSIEATEAMASEAEIRIGAQVDELAAMVQEPLNELGEHVGKVGDWLNRLIDRAEHAGKGAEHAIAQAASAGERLEAVIERLEPWKDLAASAWSGDLPPKAREVLDRLRSDIGRELEKAETVLARLSQRVQRAEAELADEPGTGSQGKAGKGSAQGAAPKPTHPELAPPPPPRIKPSRSRRPGRGDD